jgi:hypothetical protein
LIFHTSRKTNAVPGNPVMGSPSNSLQELLKLDLFVRRKLSTRKEAPSAAERFRVLISIRRPENAGKVPKIKPQLHPFTSFPIHCLLMIVSLAAT